MVLKETKTVPSAWTRTKDFLCGNLLPLVGFGILTFALAFPLFLVSDYRGSVFRELGEGIDETLIFTLCGIGLFSFGALVAYVYSEDNRALFLFFVSTLIVGSSLSFIWGRESSAHHAFEASITQEYEHKHHLDKVKVEREGSVNDTSRKVVVYRFTHPDGKSEIIAYHGDKNKNTDEITSQETITQAQRDKLIADKRNN